jgi:hypothetical protein
LCQTGGATYGGFRNRATERGKQRSDGDLRFHTVNRQCADAGQQPEGSAQHATAGGTRQGTFRSLVFFSRENSWVLSFSGKRTEWMRQPHFLE